MPYNEHGMHDNTCYFCHRPIPKYVDLGGMIVAMGFVPPSPSRRNLDDLTAEEIPHVKFKQAPTGMTATAREERCCVPCYVAEFKRLHPDAKPPRMPRPIDDEEDASVLPSIHDQVGRGDVTVASVDETVDHELAAKR